MAESLGAPPHEELLEELNLFLWIGRVRKREALEEFKVHGRESL